MKRFYKFLMPLVAIVALALPVRVMAQDTVTIGTGTSTSYYIPFNSLYGYSFTEMVYQASDIDMPGQITAVQFYLGTSNSTAQTNNITLYMKSVTRSTFSSSSDFEAVTASDIVYSGSWTIPANYTGWVNIELDTPFDYDGVSNLMVAMHESTSGYSTRYFTYTSVTGAAVQLYSDSYNPDPYNTSSYSGSSTTRNYLANMRLAITNGTITCNRVRNLTATDIAPWSCTLNWIDTLNSGASYTVITMPDSTIMASGISDTTVSLSGLTPDHSYIFGVITDCGGGDESRATTVNVHTLVSCPNPTQLTLDSITPTNAYIHWTPGFSETEWYLTIGDSVVGSITDTFYTITDLTPNTVYNLHLRAVCGADDSSIVTSLAIHTLAGEPISTFPYTCGFEVTDDGDEAADWILENGSQTNKWFVGTPGAHNGTKGLFVSDNNGTSNSYSNSSTSHVYAYAVFNFSEVGEYMISYDWKNQGESNSYDWLRVFMAPASQDFVAGSAQPLGTSTYSACTTAVAPGWFELTGRTTSPYTLAQSSTWQNVSTTFTITNPGTYKLVFMWSNDGSGGSNPPASVDNISISLNTCPAPVDLTIDSLMPTSIDLHWTAIGEETEWALQVGDTLITGITDTNYTVTGLDQYTLYTMRVYAVCDAGDTSLPTPSVTGRTTVSCPWPVSVTATATGGDTVMVTWAAGTGTSSTDFYLVYGPSGFNPASVDQSNWISASGVTSYEITGLTAGLYDVYVRCDCGGDDGISAWGGPATVGLGYMNIDQVDTLYTCGVIICDDGGPTGNYTASRNDQVVIYPVDNMHGLTITGNSYTEGSYDYVTIYEGVGTSGTILFQDNTSGVSSQLTVGPFDVEGPITITFHSDGSVYYDGFQIRVTCYDLGGCTRPSNLVCTSTTPDSVAINWNGNGAAGWDVFVGPAGAQPDADSAIAVTDSSYVFTNLSGGVAYDIYVRSDCGGEYSDWRGPLAVIPGTYIMSTTGSDTITMCGGVIYDNGGPNGQYSNNCNSTLVVYSTPGNRMTISGSYSGESCCDYLKIFDGVGTTGTPLNTTQYGSFTVGPYTSTTGVFTIQFTSDGSSVGDGYVLNIECQSLACPLATEIHAEQVSSGSAILGYTIMGITDTNTYDDLTLILTSATDTLTLHPTSDNTMVLTGLDSNTTYMAQLFTTCGGVEADTASCTFSTSALPCAVVDQAQTDTVQIGNGTSTSYYIPIGNFYNYSYTQQLILASELNGAMSISGIDFQYAYSSPSTDKTNVSIYMANVSQSSLSSSFVPYSNSFQLVYTGNLNCTTGWNHFEFTTPFSYDGSSNLLIVVHDNSGGYDGSAYTFYTHSATGMGRYVQNDGSAYNIQSVSGGTAYDYRANMKLYTFGCLQQATCAAPLVMLDSTTTTTAVVSILPGYQETSWTVEYRIVGESTWTMAGTATATSYTVTGLLSGKHYEIRVSSVCDGTSFGTTVAATTQCAVVAVTPATPYFENFEGGAPVCWSQEYVHGQYSWLLGSETYVYHNSTYQHGEGAAELYQQSNTSDTAITKLITDAFDFTALTNGARLRFYNAQLPYQTYGQPTLHLYYRTDANGAWIAFDSIMTAVTDLTQHQFILPNSAAAPYYQIAFEGHCPYGYGLNVDDVLVDAAPNCSRPVIDTVIASGATATINWTGNATSYTVSYHNFYDTVAPWTTVNVTTTTATLTGLTTGEYYEVTVTGDCGATDGLSDPSAPVFFYVPCAGQAIPYTENFDSYTNDLCYIDDAASAFAGFDNYPYVQLPNCWMFPNQSHQGISPAALLFSDSTHAFPTNCLWINARTGRDHYSVLPLMGAPIDTLVLLFDYILSSESIEIGVVTDPNDITTFVALETLTTSGSAEHYFSNDSYTWNAGQNYYIALHTFGSYYAFIDNIEVQYQPNCMKVANVHQIGGGESSVTIDWTNSSTGATPVAYQIGYAAQGTNTVSYIVSSTKPATISGLDSLTNYTVAVRAICGAGDTAFWSDATQASTEFCDGATVATTGTPTGTSYYTPLNNYYNYTLTQTIIDSAELVGIGEIGAIAYSYNYSNPSTVKTDVNIWLQPTTKTTFSSETDVVALDTNVAVQVYSGSLNCSQGWNYFTFSTPYTWDGHSNLLVIVDDNSGDYDGSSYVFDVSACTGYKTIQYYSDSYNPDINNLSGYSGLTSSYEYRATMKLVSCGGCAAPVISSVVKDYESATITVSGNGIGFELNYGTDPAVYGNTLTSTTGVFNLSGLTPATNYYFQVRQECLEGEMSSWYEGFFITDSLPCIAVSNVQITDVTYNSVSVSWTVNGDEHNWEVMVYSTVDTHTVTVQTAAATVGDLMPQRLYNVNVRPMCGSNGNIEGPWLDTAMQVTTSACQPVTDVTVTPGATMATVAWTAPAGASNFRVIYGAPDFGVGDEYGTYNTNDNPFVLTDLEANTPYTVRVANVCTESLVSQWTSADFTTTNVGINGAELDGALSLFPNPASTMVTLRVSEQMVGSTVSIVDVNGRVSGEWRVENGELTIDVSDMAKGAYFVRITGEQTTVVRKLIVE